MFLILNCYYSLFVFFLCVILSEVKNLKSVSGCNQILRVAQDDKWFIHHAKHLPEVPSRLCGQG